MERISFYILIRTKNSYNNFDRCINSVFSQKYKRYKILFVDDASSLTQNQKNHITDVLKQHTVIFNKQRLFSVRNAYNLIWKYTKNDEAVILNLDGDDWLYGSDSLSSLAKAYAEDSSCLLTYGECVLWNGISLSDKPARMLLPNVNISYPKQIINLAAYRTEPFYPLHPRTWKVWLFKKIYKRDFLRPDGTWLQFAEDQAIMYPLLEMAQGRFKVLKQPLYVYAFDHENSDENQHLIELLKDELIVRRKTIYEPV